MPIARHLPSTSAIRTRDRHEQRVNLNPANLHGSLLQHDMDGIRFCLVKHIPHTIHYCLSWWCSHLKGSRCRPPSQVWIPTSNDTITGMPCIRACSLPLLMPWDRKCGHTIVSTSNCAHTSPS